MPFALATITEAQNAAITRVVDAPGWADYVPAPVVERVYTFNPGEADAKIRSLQGRRVYCFPTEYGQAATLTRECDVNDYGLTMLVVEVYRGPEPLPPVEWIDERVAFVQHAIHDVLGDARQPLIAGRWYPQAARVPVVYDLDALQQHKTFWSFVEITLREEATTEE